MVAGRRCRPYSKMPASPLPAFLGDVVDTVASLPKRCRHRCCQLQKRCRPRCCRPSQKMPASLLSTFQKDAGIAVADLPRRCRHHCCRPSSKIPASLLPTFLGDAGIAVAGLPQRCRHRCCQPPAKVRSGGAWGASTVCAMPYRKGDAEARPPAAPLTDGRLPNAPEGARSVGANHR